MRSRQTNEVTVPRLPVFLAPSGLDVLAQWVSRLFCPPVTTLVCALLTAEFVPDASSWFWAAVYCGFTTVLPTGFVLWQVRKGILRDFHLDTRVERFRPLVVAVAGSMAAFAVLSLFSAPRLFLLVACANLLQVLLFLGITSFWKISAHTAAAAALAALAWALTGDMAVPLVMAVPLTWWARVRMGRHTVAQVAAGAALGAGLLGTALILAGVP